MPEARLEGSGSGLVPAEEGWFVVNVRDAEWLTSEGGEKRPTGSECSFEGGKTEFQQFGVRLHVLAPGQPNGLYHRENMQEDFLVLSGKCVLLVEGEKRRLRAWDFVASDRRAGLAFPGLSGSATQRRSFRPPASERSRSRSR